VGIGESARDDGRSLQAEVKHILDRAAHEFTVDVEAAKKISENFRRMFKGRRFPDTVELIREDRNR
jgi:hypothetical protein